MRRAIFAKADRIVGEDEDGLHAHERGKADCRLAVVAENQERRAVWNQRLAEGDAIEHAGHAMLAYAKMQVLSGVIPTIHVVGSCARVIGALEIAKAFYIGRSGRREVRTAADQH